MAVFNLTCLNQNDFRTDAETGCRYCIYGDKTAYESCRQTYYLKQQTEMTQQNSQNGSKEVSSEVNNATLTKMVDQQNQQISGLIQNSEQSAQKIESLNTINAALIFVLFIVVCVFLVKYFKRS